MCLPDASDIAEMLSRGPDSIASAPRFSREELVENLQYSTCLCAKSVTVLIGSQMLRNGGDNAFQEGFKNSQGFQEKQS